MNSLWNRWYVRSAASLTASMIIGFFLCFQIFGAGTIYTDDTEHHLPRIANYYLAVKQGQLLPGWAPNLNNSAGYPTFIFTYHVPYAVASIFVAIGASIEASFSYTLYFAVVLALYFAHLLAFNFLHQKVIASLCATLFVASPAFLLNLFWRGAVGELYFYGIFIMCLYFIERVHFLQSKNSTVERSSLQLLRVVNLALVCSIALLALSHQISLVIGLPLLTMLYLIIQVQHGRNITTKSIRELLVSIFLGLGISAWFLVPAFFNRKYIVLNQVIMSQSFSSEFLSPGQYFAGLLRNPDASTARELGSFGAAAFLSLLAGIIALHKKQWRISILSLVVLLLATLTFSFSNTIWQTIKILQFNQFPWRLNWGVSLVSSFSLLLFLHFSFASFSKIKKIVVSLLLLSAIGITYMSQAVVRGRVLQSDHDHFEFVGTASSFNELDTIWMNRSKEMIKTHLKVEALTSEYEISWKKMLGSEYHYTFSSQRPVLVTHNTLFFPGWRLWIDEVEEHPNVSQGSTPGYISYTIPEGEHTIRLSYSRSALFEKSGFMISILSLVLLPVFLYFQHKRSAMIDS